MVARWLMKMCVGLCWLVLAFWCRFGENGGTIYGGVDVGNG
jgi:hypothetical protein